MRRGKPVGVIIFSFLNLVFFGAVPLLAFLPAFIFAPQYLSEQITSLMKSNMPLDGVSPDTFQIRLFLGIGMAESLIFIVSGWGILLRKRWALKFTLGFCLVILSLAVITAVFSPGDIRRIILNIFYPVTLIFYFTKKDIVEYFQRPCAE